MDINLKGEPHNVTTSQVLGKAAETVYDQVNKAVVFSCLHYHIHDECFKSNAPGYKKEDKAAASKERTKKQLTLEASVKKTRKWEINDHHAWLIHTKIGEMIALDYPTIFYYG